MSLLLLLQAGGGGGPTTFNQSLTATLTRSAALVKLVKKTLGPVTLTRTAALKKTVLKPFSGSLTRSASLLAGTLHKQTLTATDTRTAALLAGIVNKKALSVTLTRTAALTASFVVGGLKAGWRMLSLAIGLRQ